ncbi:MAG: glutamate--tRNA ligase [Candidatus Peregrinibacteria bacterium]|nr:glutamate--tRNA ligase [Candidatus Peregrinibacteria bacterium]
MKDTIVRFPPSPTGKLHLGTARTALFNYLFAKKNNGKIIFRWEDTDRERSKTEFETEILDGLKWLGLDFSSMPETTFYRQTDSSEQHASGLQKLWKSEKIFPCFSTPEEAVQIKKDHPNGVFWSPFRDLPRDEAENRIKTDKFVWRIKTPKNEEITFDDIIRGKVSINTATIGDFVLARADGSVLYLLANVLDDIAQGVTNVIRGEDGLSNTPKQILLYEALGEKIPSYAHMPLVLDAQKRKLSKRNVEPGTCVLISDFREAGFLPEAVLNGLAFLGWHPKTTEEVFSLEELEKIFELKNVNPAGAQFNFEKFKFYNKTWLKKLSQEEVVAKYKDWAAEFFPELVEKYFNTENFNKAFLLATEKAVTLSDIAPEFEYLIDDPKLDKNLLQNEKFGIDQSFASKMLNEIATMLQNIDEADFNSAFIREKAIEVIAKLDVKNGQFLWPFRTALSNREKSSGPFDIAEALGKTETLRRVERAKN